MALASVLAPTLSAAPHAVSPAADTRDGRLRAILDRLALAIGADAAFLADADGLCLGASGGLAAEDLERWSAAALAAGGAAERVAGLTGLETAARVDVLLADERVLHVAAMRGVRGAMFLATLGHGTPRREELARTHRALVHALEA